MTAQLEDLFSEGFSISTDHCGESSENPSRMNDLQDDSNQQHPEGSVAWSPRMWLNFLRPGKGRTHPTTPTTRSSRRGLVRKVSTENVEEEDEGARTDPETDCESEGSPPGISQFDAEELYAHLANREEHLELDEYARYFGLIDLSLQQSSDLTFPSDDEGDCEFDAFFGQHRDDVRLLPSQQKHHHHAAEQENGFSRRVENFVMRRRTQKDDEIALLSERGDAYDRHISYNVDTVDTHGILEDLTLLELKRNAHEGEAAFDPEIDSIFLPFDRECPPSMAEYSSPVEELLMEEDEDLPMWSPELRKRLELQKAYQMKLSYGGRAPRKRPRKESQHGELWTVREASSEDEMSTGSDNTLEDC